MPEWVAYVDESESGIGAVDGPGRLVLACVVGSPEAIAELSERIRRLKLELVPALDPADWELHAGDMFHGRGVSPFGSAGMEKKITIMHRIVDIVCDSDVMTLVITVTGVRTRGKRARRAKLVEHAMALLIERLEGLALGQGVTTLRVVSDNAPEGQRMAMERALERQAAGRLSSHGGAHAVAGITFMDSRHSAALQVADAMAYAANRDARGDAPFRAMTRAIGRKGRRSP